MSRLARADQKFFVHDVVDPVALQAWMGWVNFQFKGGELGSFLLFSTELVQAGLEAVGEEEKLNGEEWHGIRKAAAATKCSAIQAEHGAVHQR